MSSIEKNVKHLETTTSDLRGKTVLIEELGKPLQQATHTYLELLHLFKNEPIILTNRALNQRLYSLSNEISPLSSEIQSLSKEIRQQLIRRVEIVIETLEMAFHGRRDFFDGSNNLVEIEGNPDTKILMKEGNVRIPPFTLEKEGQNMREYEITRTKKPEIS